MSMRLRIIFIILIIVTAIFSGAGCHKIDYDRGGFSCQNNKCPDGYTCVNESGKKTCRSISGTIVPTLTDGSIADTFANKIDANKPDVLIADSLKRDCLINDISIPDAPPIKYFTDDTFSDFTSGTLSESGAKIYVSAKGNVQLLDRLDLNGDGYLDLALPNLAVGSATGPSYIYWGSQTGLSSSNKATIPSVMAEVSAVADINDDGYVDIVLGYRSDVNQYQQYGKVVVYQGTANGYASNNTTTLQVNANALSLSIGDINRDGHLDLAVCRTYDGTSSDIKSYVYWGGASGFSDTNRLELPTHGASGVAIADLNKDAYLDIVFANSALDSSSKNESYIYWGSASGLSATNRTSLPTLRARTVSVADLNNDGKLDIIFGNGIYTFSNVLETYIYWGTSTGYSATSRDSLPSMNAFGLSVADVNKDGYLDIAISNINDYNNNNFHLSINSYLYLGAKTGFSVANRVDLPTLGAEGTRLVDLNADGYIDLVFGNAGDQGINESFIYWGAATGYSVANRLSLPTLHATHMMEPDPGSVYDRKPEQTFISRINDMGISSPTLKTISWIATIPQKTSLKFQIRSASTSDGLSSADWYGPTLKNDYYATSGSAINPVHNGNRFVQYKAFFSSDFGSTPVLDKVTLSFR